MEVETVTLFLALLAVVSQGAGAGGAGKAKGQGPIGPVEAKAPGPTGTAKVKAPGPSGAAKAKPPGPSGTAQAKGQRATVTAARRPQGSGRRGSAAAGRPGWAVPAAVLGVVAALLLVAVVVTKANDGGGAGEATAAVEVRPVTVAGAALAAHSDVSPDPAVGAVAPTVTGTTFEGQPMQVGGTGRPALVLFVAHWCPHCQREVPVLAPELDRITPAGVDFVAVSTGVRPGSDNYPPSKWLEREDWPRPVLADDKAGSAAQAYGLGGFPYYVALDAEGKVAARASGEKTVAEVQELLAKVTPAA